MKILFFAIMTLLHPVHVSLTGIEYDSSNRIYSVFVKVYSDDLEADIGLGSSEGEAITGEGNDRYCKYLCDRLLILEDGKRLDMRLMNVESDGLEHRFSLEANGGRSVGDVSVINRIMTRLYYDQVNMLLFKFGTVEDGYKFTVTDTLKSYNVK
jgi:hypothetical protein